MLLVATAYKYMNKADPDAGTTFSWVTRAFGPNAGWIAGWAIVVADIIVMANLAQIAGLYSFLLFGIDDPSTLAVTVVGVVWIAVMTYICVIGIELNAKSQRWLLTAEIVTLAIFAAVALIRVWAGDAPAASLHPDISWFSPFAIDSTSALTSGVLLAVFIYWGWDSLVCVNEETEDAENVPGRAAILATIILLGIYVVVSTAAIAYGGADRLANDQSGDVLGLLANDVFGSSLLGKIVIIAVLSSAAASTQTTILPTSRTALSMARAKAFPRGLAHIHQRYQTPDNATWWMGGLSILWYVGLTLVSEDILFDSIAALGLMIAFYYGLTGFACALYYRREARRSVKGLLFAVVAPALGGVILTWVLVKSIVELSDPANSESGNAWLGVGPPLVIGVGFMALGAVLMVLCSRRERAFFRQHAEVFASAE
jgi:amino acid transporter